MRSTGSRLRRSVRLGLAAWLLSTAIAGCAGSQETASAPAPAAGPELRVTTGAAPGYVEDAACRGCHADLWESYQHVGMARSFYRPRADRFIEDLEGDPFFHEPSGRHYEMRRDGDGLVFRRFQRDPDGRPINEFEIDVDWILGSGNHARSYLYQTEMGELYELPVNWYSQTGEWGMAPGFEGPDHAGVLRSVTRECLFCHNAFPEVPEGSDRAIGSQVFPRALPEGTGCQRCHGPGGEHVRLAIGMQAAIEEVRAAIVNPGRLASESRNDVCYECHMQPSFLVRSVVRFDRGIYSFRPGQSLAEYRVEVDPVMQGEERSERFEINHHPYRLEQSACFIQSRERGGDLSCLTCHDPHRKVPVEERAAHYRTACAGCHALDADAFREAHAPATESPGESDCTVCHMPERRTQDVVMVTMTDHFIRRIPAGGELTAPIEKDPAPKFVGVELHDPERAPAPLTATVYRAVAALRTDANEAAVNFLERALPDLGVTEPAPWLDLAAGQIALGRLGQAEQTLQRVLAGSPDDPLALESLGRVNLLANDLGTAAVYLLRAVESDPQLPQAHYYLGLSLRPSDPERALDSFERTIALRPNHTNAWFHRGLTLRDLGRPNEAEAHFRRALEIEPRHTGSYRAIAVVLDELGRPGEATRFLRHGSVAAADPEPVREALRGRKPAQAPGS